MSRGPVNGRLDNRDGRKEGRLALLHTCTTDDQPLFELGQIVATPGAISALERANQTPIEFLLRHVTGDWGKLDAQDRAENEHSLPHGFRLLSSYLTKLGETIWVITEADRSATTLLLPEEY